MLRQCKLSGGCRGVSSIEENIENKAGAVQNSPCGAELHDAVGDHVPDAKRRCV